MTNRTPLDSGREGLHKVKPPLKTTAICIDYWLVWLFEALKSPGWIMHQNRYQLLIIATIHLLSCTVHMSPTPCHNTPTAIGLPPKTLLTRAITIVSESFVSLVLPHRRASKFSEYTVFQIWQRLMFQIQSSYGSLDINKGEFCGWITLRDRGVYFIFPLPKYIRIRCFRGNVQRCTFVMSECAVQSEQIPLKSKYDCNFTFSQNTTGALA